VFWIQRPALLTAEEEEPDTASAKLSPVWALRRPVIVTLSPMARDSLGMSVTVIVLAAALVWVDSWMVMVFQ